jgi:hypothetical protein
MMIANTTIPITLPAIAPEEREDLDMGVEVADEGVVGVVVELDVGIDVVEDAFAV